MRHAIFFTEIRNILTELLPETPFSKRRRKFSKFGKKKVTLFLYILLLLLLFTTFVFVHKKFNK